MKNVLTILATLISVVSLGLSIYTYNKHQYQLVEDKQINAVVNLVEYIQDCKLSILYNPEPIEFEKRTHYVYTFFELAYSTICSDIDSIPIYFPNDENLPFDFRPYINNPLIPSEIATKLKDYYRYHSEPHCNYDAVVMSNVIITRFDDREFKDIYDSEYLFNLEREYGLDNISVDYEHRFNSFPYIPALRNFREFKAHNKELYDIIVKWFVEKGIDNVNMPKVSRLYEHGNDITY